MNISNAFISIFQNKKFMEANVIDQIIERLNVWEKLGYYPVTDTFINSCSSKGLSSVSVMLYPDKIVIRSDFSFFDYSIYLRVISIKFDRKRNEITRLHLGKLLYENEEVELLLLKIKSVAQLPDKEV